MRLLLSRRLGPLLITQTLGAFNDNLFKNALVVLILFRTAERSGPALVALAGGVFILPYVILSATAGQIADRFERSRTMLLVKAAEVVLMLLAAAGFLIASTPMLFGVLFGLGVQATFFSPLKYGILPNLLDETELVAGNGLVEAGTFLGILAGTIAGSALFALPEGPVIVSVCGLLVAAGGVAAAAFVERTSSGDRAVAIGRNPLQDTWRLLGEAKSQRPVWLSIVGLSWFWTLGAIVLTELPTIVRADLDADPQVFTVLLTFFSAGIGAGSLLCARLLRGEVSARLVPIAAVGLSVFLWDFGRAVHAAPPLQTAMAILAEPGGWRMLADLLLLAGCGGLYSVPLYAIIQTQSAPGREGSMVAANNVVNAVAMVAAAGVTALLAAYGMAPVTVLVITAGGNLVVAAWLAWRHRTAEA